MTAPKCPLCNGVAVETDSGDRNELQQASIEGQADFVVCHCSESHRFVVAPVEPARVVSAKPERID
jgi:hypothetical protein